MRQISLVDAVFSKNYQFEAGIFCSYGLNLNFFENYLMNLSSLYSCDDVCIFTDAETYDGFINCEYNPRWLNKRYLVNRVKTKGVFHSKLYMFASEKRAVFGIGSANLTRDGITSNLELLSVFEVTEKETQFGGLLKECIEYVERLAKVTKSTSAIKQVNSFRQICSKYINGQSSSPIRLVHNLDKPMIDALIALAKENDAKKIQIVSPFYDSGLAPYSILKKELPEAKFEFYLQQHKSNFPKEMAGKLSSAASLHVYHDVERYIHGKAVVIHGAAAPQLFIGSANFTHPALNLTSTEGNYEIALVGEFDSDYAKEILCPAGHQADKCDHIESICVSPAEVKVSQPETIDYLVEVKRNHDTLEILADDTVSADSFTPDQIVLIDNDRNGYEAKLQSHTRFVMSSAIQKNISGKLAVQLLGHNSSGESLRTNIVWVVELEERSGSSMPRRVRRVYNDPLELRAVLQEILESGTEDELRLFLLQFDIPSDLIFHTTFLGNGRATATQGNILGGLPPNFKGLSHDAFKKIFEDCLARLEKKLRQHVDNPQADKISNFMLLLSCFYSLIEFVNQDWLYLRYPSATSVSSDDWHEIKNVYRMLFMHMDSTWQIVWGKGGYREVINARLAAESAGEVHEGLTSFEHQILDEYEHLYDEITDYALEAINNYVSMKTRLKVRNVYGQLVPPPVFEVEHLLLKDEPLAKFKERIENQKKTLADLREVRK